MFIKNVVTQNLCVNRINFMQTKSSCDIMFLIGICFWVLTNQRRQTVFKTWQKEEAIIPDKIFDKNKKNQATKAADGSSFTK